jgi:hypothetical protein
MCGKPRIGKAFRAQRTLRADAAHCRIRKKHKQKQPTDRAAPCGLLSGPLSVGSCTPSLIALPSFRKCAASRHPAKTNPRASMQPVEMLQIVMQLWEAPADGESDVKKWLANSAIIAVALMRILARTDRLIAVQ